MTHQHHQTLYPLGHCSDFSFECVKIFRFNFSQNSDRLHLCTYLLGTLFLFHTLTTCIIHTLIQSPDHYHYSTHDENPDPITPRQAFPSTLTQNFQYKENVPLSHTNTSISISNPLSPLAISPRLSHAKFNCLSRNEYSSFLHITSFFHDAYSRCNSAASEGRTPLPP